MAKKTLLLLETDPQLLRLLEVSLKETGYTITIANDAADALTKIELTPPQLTLANTSQGFALRERLLQSQDWAQLPFLFLLDQGTVEERMQALSLGVEDCVAKPVYVKELVARVKILLQKHQRDLFQNGSGKQELRVSGRLTDMGVVDLLQSAALGRKSGVLHLRTSEGRRAAIYLRNGKVIDAELGRLVAEDALYRLLVWTEGEFEFEPKQIRRKEVIEASSEALLFEGMRRLEEWGRLCEQLPPLGSVFEVDYRELGDRLSEIPDEINSILRLFDGRRSLLQVVEDCDFGDLEALTVLSKLYFEKLIFPASAAAAQDEPVPLDLPEPAMPPTVESEAHQDDETQRHLREKMAAPAGWGHDEGDEPSTAREEAAEHRGEAPQEASDNIIPFPTPSHADAETDSPEGRTEASNESPEQVEEPPATGRPTTRRNLLLGSGLLAVAAGVVWGVVHRTGPVAMAPVAVAPTLDAAAVVDAAMVAASTPPAPPPKTPESPTYEALLAQVKELTEHHRAAKALPLLEQAISIKADGVEALVLLANIHLDRGHASKASDYAHRAATADPTNPDAQLVQGAADQQLGHNGEARAAYQKYLQLAPHGKYASDIRAVLKELK